MTRSGVTIDDVRDAAEMILAQGENPTIEKIRRELGTGSNSTIAKYLNEWRTQRLIATTDYLPAPHLPPDPVNAAVTQVWEKIRAESTAEIKAIQEKAKKEIEEALLERNHTILERDQLQQEIENQQKRLNQTLADKELLTLDLKALQQDHLILQERYKGLESEYHVFKEENNNKISLLQTIHKKEMEDREATMVSIQKTHDNVIQGLFATQENHRQQHIAEIDSHKIEQRKLNKLLESMALENKNIAIELQDSRATIKKILLEKDLAINEVHEKNKLIENNHVMNTYLCQILDEIKPLKNTEKADEILLTINQLNKKLNDHDTRLSFISNSLEKLNEISE